MKVYDYGKWTKIYKRISDGYGFSLTEPIMYPGHLTELQISEICRDYASFTHLVNGNGPGFNWNNLPNTDGYGNVWL